MQAMSDSKVVSLDVVIRRYLARSVDLILLFALLILMASIDPLDWYGSILAALTLLPIEAVTTWLFGATPGKFLLRIRVRSSTGAPLTLLQALKRSISVWVFGQAVGIAVAMPFSAGIAYGRLRDGRETIWDEWAHTIVQRSR